MPPTEHSEGVTLGEVYRLVEAMGRKIDALSEGMTKDRLAIAAIANDQKTLGVIVRECPVSRDKVVTAQIQTVTGRVTEVESQISSARWFGLSLVLGILGTIGYWVKQAIEHALMRPTP